VLTSISELLANPNTEDPLLPGVAEEMKTDAEGLWTQKYAH
jgi:ubiquitin-protein ligase